MSDPRPERPSWARALDDDPEAIIPLMPAGWSPPASTGPEPARSGILVVDKPAGRTSHDVVQAVRRASGVRRVGHAGTLDPLATGVLVVCLGSATRVIEEIQSAPKSYTARILLGVSTTTYDAEGEVVDRRDAADVTREAAIDALSRFRGVIEQVPPMYSAVKHQGRRLYDLARKGLEVERAARPVTVHAVELTDWQPPELELRMRVSSGTYVRSIAHDLGQDLGVGAHLVALRRTAVGRFDLASAHALPRLVEAFAEGWWPHVVHALDAALLDYTAMVVGPEAAEDIAHGRAFAGPTPGASTTRLVRAYDRDGRFLALVRWDDVDERWLPDRVFPVPS